VEDESLGARTRKRGRRHGESPNTNIGRMTRSAFAFLATFLDNWDLGRLGNQSTDAIAGSLLRMFDFNEDHQRAPALVLNPLTGR
jgi:hypothetical protein